MNLNEFNARRFRPRKGVIKYAVLCDEPVTFQKPSWGKGGQQIFTKPFILIAVPRENKEPNPQGLIPYDVYGSAIDKFLNMHEPIPEVRNGWRKKTNVLAIRLTRETEVLTIVSGKEEAKTKAPAGHWLVQQPGGEQQVIAPEQFASLYEEVEPSD